MKLHLWLLLIVLPSLAQPQAAVTRDELEYLRFLLLSVATSIDVEPKATTTFERLLVRQFGLTTEESTAIHAAGMELNALLAQQHQTTKTIIPGPTGFSLANSAIRANLFTQREQRIEVLANRILSQVRPQVAERLRKPGKEVTERNRRITAR
jgi:hypothetical protein